MNPLLLFFSTPVGKWIATLALLTAGVFLVYFQGHHKGFVERDVSCKAEVSAIHAQWMEAERVARDEREKGRAIADAAAREHAQYVSRITTLQGKLDDEIRNRASAVRRALDGQLVGLLNRLSPIRESVDPAGAAAPGTAAQAPPAATDQAGSASEYAVATALKESRGGYEICRDRLNRLIDWAQAVTQ